MNIFIFTFPLTVGVVGAPQVTLQPTSFRHFSEFFSVLHCPLGLSERQQQACPFLEVVFPPLFPSAVSSSPFHSPLQDGFGHT